MKLEEKRFTYKGKEYLLLPMTSQDLSEGRKLYARTFRKSVENGVILKKSLDDHMRRQGLWDDHKQEEYTNLIKKSADLEYRIKSGQFKKASELKDKALELKSVRDEISNLMAVRNSMDSVTAEGQAEQERFGFFIHCSIHFFDTRKRVFPSYDSYLDQSDTDFGRDMAGKFAEYYYGVDEDFESKFLENKILKKLNLLDGDGFLVNTDGKRVDNDGNLIDEDGARINEKGERIDINNNPLIDDDIIDSLDFEDDLPKSKKIEKPEVKKAKRKSSSNTVA